MGGQARCDVDGVPIYLCIESDFDGMLWVGDLQYYAPDPRYPSDDESATRMAMAERLAQFDQAQLIEMLLTLVDNGEDG